MNPYYEINLAVTQSRLPLYTRNIKKCIYINEKNIYIISNKNLVWALIINRILHYKIYFSHIAIKEIY